MTAHTKLITDPAPISSTGADTTANTNADAAPAAVWESDAAGWGDEESRRLPVYLVLDCSGSMTGEPIEAVRQGMKTLLSELKSDPQALETVYLSVITFDTVARQAVPLTELILVKEPAFEATGTTALGAALKLLRECIAREVRATSPTQKGDWKPLVFLMTDGAPTDKWEPEAQAIKGSSALNIIACAAGAQADEDTLKKIASTVVRLNDLQPDALKQFFQWVSASVSTSSVAVAQSGAPIGLPALPPQITIVL